MDESQTRVQAALDIKGRYHGLYMANTGGLAETPAMKRVGSRSCSLGQARGMDLRHLAVDAGDTKAGSLRILRGMVVWGLKGWFQPS